MGGNFKQKNQAFRGRGNGDVKAPTRGRARTAALPNRELKGVIASGTGGRKPDTC